MTNCITPYLSDLHDAEKQLNTPGIDEQDSIELTELCDSALLELETLSGGETSLLEDLQGFRDSSAAELLLQNDNLEDSAPYQSNEKWVNKLMLNTVVQNMYSFSEGQIDTLEAIANACPLSDGEAVLKARALLTLIDGSLNFYDDTQLCDPGEERSKPIDQNPVFRVYPNPASNAVIVEYDLVDNEERELIFFNVFGQVVTTARLTGESKTTTIHVHDLPPGMYWYTLSGLKNTTKPGKVIIQH